MPTEGLYLMDNTYIPMLGRVPVENTVIARCGLTGVSFVCQIKSGGECVRPVQSIIPQRAIFLFHFVWLCFFGAYDLRPTVERHVSRGYTSWVPYAALILPWLRRLALASSAMGSSLNRVSTSLCRICIQHASRCGTTE
ncbi:hypothetical protein BCR43DRAFT_500206 [Syncephalastrum racemosum]|uniref:Uncharacterized protein n=1 Tax=Syncephalastrum racemosum TaxID=13706 RepID=A0A1X2GZZ9_SYNRA|nr:hypothetical protein BCR43DRAFT_500206 [Syncephalastrum racemosum]